jgi:uncharacterized membrane protein (UPF0182 family)
MEENLELALQRIFGGRVTREATSVVAPELTRGDRTVANRALEHYTRSQEYLRQGNWAGFGEELKKLEDLLKEMQKGR